MIRSILLLFFSIVVLLAHSQDRQYATSLVDTLSSNSMFGRGYVNNGDGIAAEFISQCYTTHGLLSFSENYKQSFTIPINTFPGKISLKIGNRKLIPGKEFVVYSSSPSANGKFKLVWEESIDKIGGDYISSAVQKELSSKVVITSSNPRKFDRSNPFFSAGILYLQEKVSWHVSDGGKVNDFFTLAVQESLVPENAKNISIEVENNFIGEYQTQNVIGYIKGTEYPDSFIVFSAHYDHLGMMGKEAIFPGANDNASGTAMIIDLAAHFSKPENKPSCSIVFMAFSAEEAGLYGSFHYVENPLFPLENIKFLINLDLVGSGSEGIKVVNATVFKKRFEQLVSINETHNYLKKISPRGEAANSDHYPFYAKGIPCFFIYTLGDESKEYHTVFDTPKNVPYTKYDDLFRLFLDFIKQN